MAIEADVLRRRHGAQGQLDGASKGTLENEFGTANDDEVIKQILEKGAVQESEVCLSHSLPFIRRHSSSLPPSLPLSIASANILRTSSLSDKATRMTPWATVEPMRVTKCNAHAPGVMRGLGWNKVLAWMHMGEMVACGDKGHEGMIMMKSVS
jgi:hypothetical protein